jgi:hypothetical protein
MIRYLSRATNFSVAKPYFYARMLSQKPATKTNQGFFKDNTKETETLNNSQMDKVDAIKQITHVNLPPDYAPHSILGKSLGKTTPDTDESFELPTPML